MKYNEVFREIIDRLQEAQVPDCEVDARILLQEVCDFNRTDLLIRGDMDMPEDQYARLGSLTEKRSKRIPLQQLLGHTDFMGLTFQVNEHVLCPRQDTEILVEEVMKHMHEDMRILDMCTGSGCILISLLHYSNMCTGVGADLSEAALAVAKENASMLQVDDRAVFVQSDLFEQIEGTFDLIVSNPPYIPSKVVDTLMPEVKDHEPRMALDGTEDGLFFYREISRLAMEHLSGGGMLFYEIGYDQGDAVSRIMIDQGFTQVEVLQDYAGLDRVVLGCKSSLK